MKNKDRLNNHDLIESDRGLNYFITNVSNDFRQGEIVYIDGEENHNGEGDDEVSYNHSVIFGEEVPHVTNSNDHERNDDDYREDDTDDSNPFNINAQGFSNITNSEDRKKNINDDGDDEKREHSDVYIIYGQGFSNITNSEDQKRKPWEKLSDSDPSSLVEEYDDDSLIFGQGMSLLTNSEDTKEKKTYQYDMTNETTSIKCEFSNNEGISSEVDFLYSAETTINDTSFIPELESLILDTLSSLLRCTRRDKRNLRKEIIARKLKITGVDSIPNDYVSSEVICEPVFDKDNSCFVIHGFVTLTSTLSDNFEDREKALNAIKYAMENDDYIEPQIKNLKKVTFLDGYKMQVKTNVANVPPKESSPKKLWLLLLCVAPFLVFCCCCSKDRKKRRKLRTKKENDIEMNKSRNKQRSGNISTTRPGCHECENNGAESEITVSPASSVSSACCRGRENPFVYDKDIKSRETSSCQHGYGEQSRSSKNCKSTIPKVIQENKIRNNDETNTSKYHQGSNNIFTTHACNDELINGKYETRQSPAPSISSGLEKTSFDDDAAITEYEKVDDVSSNCAHHYKDQSSSSKTDFALGTRSRTTTSLTSSVISDESSYIKNGNIVSPLDGSKNKQRSGNISSKRSCHDDEMINNDKSGRKTSALSKSSFCNKGEFLLRTCNETDAAKAHDSSSNCKHNYEDSSPFGRQHYDLLTCKSCGNSEKKGINAIRNSCIEEKYINDKRRTTESSVSSGGFHFGKHHYSKDGRKYVSSNCKHCYKDKSRIEADEKNEDCSDVHNCKSLTCKICRNKDSTVHFVKTTSFQTSYKKLHRYQKCIPESREDLYFDDESNQSCYSDEIINE